MIDYTEALIATRPVRVRRRVLWGECDPAAVVYTPRFIDYAAAAQDWFRRTGIGLIDRLGPGPTQLIYPLRAIAVDFVSFLSVDDVFDMTVLVAGVSSRTFSTNITGVHQSGRCAFNATLTAVCVESETRRSVPLPAEVREALAQYRSLQSS